MHSHETVMNHQVARRVEHEFSRKMKGSLRNPFGAKILMHNGKFPLRVDCEKGLISFVGVPAWRRSTS